MTDSLATNPLAALLASSPDTFAKANALALVTLLGARRAAMAVAVLERTGDCTGDAVLSTLAETMRDVIEPCLAVLEQETATEREQGAATIAAILAGVPQQPSKAPVVAAPVVKAVKAPKAPSPVHDTPLLTSMLNSL